MVQPLNEHLAREGASWKLEQVLLSEDALKAFQALKQACMSTPVLAFTDYTKDFLLKIDTSKEGLGMVLSQKQADGWYHLVIYGSQALTAHEKNYHSTKLEFLALKWAITEHFKEYLLYQPFLVRTDINPLTYIMTTPNLDATGHQWVGALAKFNFWLEYQKGWDTTVVDVLSQITTRLSPEAMQSVLDGVMWQILFCICPRYTGDITRHLFGPSYQWIRRQAYQKCHMGFINVTERNQRMTFDTAFIHINTSLNSIHSSHITW